MLSPATQTAADVTKKLAENDVRSNIDKTLHRVEDNARQVIDDLSARAGETGSKVRHLIDDASGSLKKGGDRLNQEVHNNPVRSSLLALGAGVAIGLLLRR